MNFASLSTRACLALALGGAVVAAGVSAGLEWWGISHLRTVIATVRDGDVPLAEAVGSLHDDVLQLRRYEKDVFINLASAERRDGYRAKWDEAFLHLRHDLVRTRALDRESAGARLREFEASIAEYRGAFLHTDELIRRGHVATAQQANAQMGEAKEAAHRAEQQLVEIEQRAQLRVAQVGDPVSEARWASLALNLVLLAMVGGPLAWAMRQRPQALAHEI